MGTKVPSWSKTVLVILILPFVRTCLSSNHVDCSASGSSSLACRKENASKDAEVANKRMLEVKQLLEVQQRYRAGLRGAAVTATPGSIALHNISSMSSAARTAEILRRRNAATLRSSYNRKLVVNYQNRNVPYHLNQRLSQRAVFSPAHNRASQQPLDLPPADIQKFLIQLDSNPDNRTRLFGWEVLLSSLTNVTTENEEEHNVNISIIEAAARRALSELHSVPLPKSPWQAASGNLWSSPLPKIPELNRPPVMAVLPWIAKVSQVRTAAELSANLSGLATAVGALELGSTGYPVTRRLIARSLIMAASIVKADWSESIKAIVRQICGRLFELHSHSVRERGVIEYMHISKAGGSSVCKAAERMGCQTQSFGQNNCLIRRFNDFPRWVLPSQHRTNLKRPTASLIPIHIPHFVSSYNSPRLSNNCSQRRAFMKAHGWNFYANEYTTYNSLNASLLPPSMLDFQQPNSLSSAAQVHTVSGSPTRTFKHLTPTNSHIGEQAVSPEIDSEHPSHPQLCANEFVELLVMRTPAARLVSHMRYIVDWYESNYKVAGRSFFSQHDAAHWLKIAPSPMDNYLVRSLLGEHAFHAPVGSLTLTQLRDASLMLLQVDLVAVLDRKSNADEILRLGLGWAQSLDVIHHNKASAQQKRFEWLPNDIEKLKDLNYLDEMLYRYGGDVERLDRVVFKIATAECQQGKKSSVCSFVPGVQRNRCGYAGSSHA